MRATDLLRKQYRDIDGLFRQVDSTDDAGLAELFDLVAARVVAHDTIEREHFYPACRKVLGEADPLLDDSLVEHGLVLVCITEVERSDERHFRQAVGVLGDVVAQHAQKEEAQLFPRVEAALDTRALEELGARMERGFERALTTNLHTAVRVELRLLFSRVFGDPSVGDDARAAPRGLNGAAR